MFVLGYIIYPFVSICGLPLACTAQVRSLTRPISLETYVMNPFQAVVLNEFVVDVGEQPFAHVTIHIFMLLFPFLSGALEYVLKGCLLIGLVS